MIEINCYFGRKFVLEAQNTALLAIDFQRDFLDFEGGCNISKEQRQRLRNAIEPASEALLAARTHGLTVIHTKESYAPDLSELTALKKSMNYVDNDGPLGRCLIRGQDGCEIIPEMAPLDEELIIDKAGFSAFYQTPLHEHLQKSNITHLIFTGVTYQCCVHSSLRDAVDRGYFCLTLDDACAATEPELESASKEIICGEDHLFGWLSTSEHLCDALNV